ncbi:MAG: helix-turn-helix transcriptional regulator [Candidatus Aminicenantes bacterium]|nr:helix-turn-helix transcriptional regulator [Candidatus Aminicenantes bacterium]
MRKSTESIRGGVARRLAKLRYLYNYPLQEMARRVGLSSSGYFKNENGVSFPKLETLQRLEKDFDVSMDWLIFNKGPIHYKDVLAGKGVEKISPSLEATVPEIKELMGCMEQDILFRHEVLVFFYKYRNKKPESLEQERETGAGKK